MNRGIFILIIIAVLVLALGSLIFFANKGANNAGNEGNLSNITNFLSNISNSTHDVFIQNIAFNPGSLTIKAGDTIIWTNMDNVAHTVTSDSGTELHSGTLSTGDTYSHIFTKAGTYTYHCSIHTMMKGTVIVQ